MQFAGTWPRLQRSFGSRPGKCAGRVVAAAVAAALAAPLLGMVGAFPARAQDISDMVVRLGQLEEQMRNLSGRVEQLQFENRRLNEQLRKFQQDTEFRFQERGGAGGAPAAPAAPPPRDRRGDAGATPPGSAGSGPSTASISRNADGFEAARAQFQQGQYGAAEMGFRQFLQANPSDRRAADAIYWLGESYYQRQQYSDAAEQFLKISTDYPKASRGPDALVKLGMALSRLNAKPEACATLAQVVRKYPNASAEVRSAVERERRRSKC